MPVSSPLPLLTLQRREPSTSLRRRRGLAAWSYAGMFAQGGEAPRLALSQWLESPKPSPSPPTLGHRKP